MRRSALWSLFVVVTVAACGDSSGSGGEEPRACVAHNAPQLAALSTPPTSFENDVAPILAKSCAFSSCHGSRTPANRGVFLGATNPDNIAQVKSGLRASARSAPALAYVTPGDPDKSFLMHKLDGDQCIVSESCNGGDCGKSMPEGNELLPESSRDTIRRWIAQGAN
jgi:hypothetical protein